jgi:TPR repeat protein
MNSKISGIIIIALLGIIGYQSGFLDKYFSNNSIDCNSKEAISLGQKIIEEKHFPRLFNNIKYTIEDIEFNTIITKKIDNDTGAQECSATADILADFQLNKKSKEDEHKFFNLLLGSEKVVSLGDNKFLISSSIYYTTEVTSDRKQYMINLKFDGDRTSLYNKNNLTTDAEDTFRLILPFAKKGNPKLQNKIGVMYSFGEGVKKDYNRAFEWYEKSANQNYPWGLYNLANMYYDGKGIEKDYKKAFELFKKSAELGNYDAQNRLANMYYDGKGIQQDYKQAIYWYEKSANQQYDWAFHNLANMYYNGKGIEKDYKKAFELFKKSAELGNYDAQNRLANMYYDGKGIQQDYKQAIYWYEKSANQQYDWAFHNLANMYYNGKGIEKDYKKAFNYYTLAANKGNKEAQYNLGIMYLKGEGINKDEIKAKEWFKKSCFNEKQKGCDEYNKLTKKGY